MKILSTVSFLCSDRLSALGMPPSRTEADKTNDRTTLDRALDERLMLIVKPTPDADWRLPESGWEVGSAPLGHFLLPP